MTPDTAAGEFRSADHAGKYLTFELAQEEYGVPVLKVREIVRMVDITPVPHMPPYVRGVINLRGKVIPVMDLRLKLGFPRQDYTERTCIVIVEVALTTGRVLMGMVVDRVADVLNITSGEIDATPEFGERVQTGYMCGVAKVKGRVTILIDLDQVLGSDSMAVTPRVF
jgi:purine-binding chemotaxis protein CheW